MAEFDCISKYDLKINLTVCNEHHKKYPIHEILTVGKGFNVLGPALGILFVSLYYSVASVVYNRNQGGNSNADSLTGGCVKSLAQLSSIKNFLEEEGLSRAKKGKYDKIHMIHSNVFNGLKMACTVFWYYAAPQDTWGLALSWCVVYPILAVGLQIGNILRLIYGKFRSATVFVWIIYMFMLIACDVFVIYVGFSFLHHVSYNPISPSVVIQRY